MPTANGGAPPPPHQPNEHGVVHTCSRREITVRVCRTTYRAEILFVGRTLFVAVVCVVLEQETVLLRLRPGGAGVKKGAAGGATLGALLRAREVASKQKRRRRL